MKKVNIFLVETERRYDSIINKRTRKILTCDGCSHFELNSSFASFRNALTTGKITKQNMKVFRLHEYNNRCPREIYYTIFWVSSLRWSVAHVLTGNHL